MMEAVNKYEAVIGLEVHAQLSTNSKAYSSDDASYGAFPNSHVSQISLGHPGTLPKVNEAAIKYAIKAGLALHCKINKYNEYARKNYFYADLPKGYQITQDTTPICTNGYINISIDDVSKKIGITRIHMEEDSGKSMHDQDPYYSLIDLNRAGVALIEIVSEPDMRSGDEAYQYLSEIRKLVRYLDICDGNMEEGSLRCDANISIRLKGNTKFSTRVEVKNMNSLRNVKRAIDYEINRQVEVVEAGGVVVQSTLGYDPVANKTFVMRSKEMAHDYRYFPEPDLPPVMLKDEYIENVKSAMPALPHELFKKFTAEYGLSDYDAEVLTGEKEIALYFESLIAELASNEKADKKLYKTAANWLNGPIKNYLNENAIGIGAFPISLSNVVSLIKLVHEDKISHSIAVQKIFPVLLDEKESNPIEVAKAQNLLHDNNEDAVQQYIQQALDKYPDKVADYKNGNKNLLGLFMGELMKISKGQINPKVANQALREALEK